ncbi:MAG: hypothetical protein ACYDBX_03515 [Patescibacteria group bacterium]
MMDIKNNIDLNKLLQKHRILFFGDDHDMNQGREWLAREINKLEKIDFIAIEYVDTSSQKLIDNGEYTKLKIYLRKTYKDFKGLSPESIINLIKVAKSKNIKIFGIEMPENSFDNWDTKQAQEERIKYISKEILKIAKLGNGIVLLGADHTEKGQNNIFGNIKSKYSEVISLVFIGGKSWSQDTEDYWIRKLEMDFQKDKNFNNMFISKIKNNIYPTDYIIHFPQKEKLKK